MTGKPVDAGGSPQGSTMTRRPVHAGSPRVRAREARPRGRPQVDNTTTYRKPVNAGGHRDARRSGRSTPRIHKDEEAGLSPETSRCMCVCTGSPLMGEAQCHAVFCAGWPCCRVPSLRCALPESHRMWTVSNASHLGQQATEWRLPSMQQPCHDPSVKDQKMAPGGWSCSAGGMPLRH